MYSGNEDKPLADLKIGTERWVENSGASEQYQYVRKIKLNSIDGLLDIYDKIYNSDFTTYDKTGINLLEGKKKEKVGKLMMGFNR